MQRGEDLEKEYQLRQVRKRSWGREGWEGVLGGGKDTEEFTANDSVWRDPTRKSQDFILKD